MINNNISRYDFHDGSIINIVHTDTDIKISMESAEIWPEDLDSSIKLIERRTIKGILHLSEIRSIEIDGKVSHETLKMAADFAEIIRFDITESKIHFFIEWINFPRIVSDDPYLDIVINADSITWQNTPKLLDP